MTRKEIENILYKNIEEINWNLPANCYLLKEEVPIYAEILAVLSSLGDSVWSMLKVLDTAKGIVSHLATF